MLSSLELLFCSARALADNVLIALYRTPLFRARCESSGRNLVVERLPQVLGHARIFIGNDVRIAGLIGIFSGRTLDNPRLAIGNGVTIADQVTFSVNREVVVEDGVSIGAMCSIVDNDGHPRDAEGRVRDAAPAPEDVVPVRICRDVRLGYGSYILKGVTIGEGAVIRARSVVTSDIPPHTEAGGNPARRIA
jgi:acetyltransferase-like isoleucine patch superfamily enzyme